jgi:hypothetical protein
MIAGFPASSIVTCALRIAFVLLVLGAPPAMASGFVYQCTIDGQRTLSDRPSTSVRTTSADARAAARAECREIQARIDRIDARMRLGYRNRIGERLKAERRDLTDRYAGLRCNTTSR